MKKITIILTFIALTFSVFSQQAAQRGYVFTDSTFLTKHNLNYGREIKITIADTTMRERLDSISNKTLYTKNHKIAISSLKNIKYRNNTKTRKYIIFSSLGIFALSIFMIFLIFSGILIFSYSTILAAIMIVFFFIYVLLSISVIIAIISFGLLALYYSLKWNKIRIK